MTEKEFSSVRIRVTVLMKHEDGRLIMVRHNKAGRRYWLLPGGGQIPGESLEAAAHRELFEEVRVTAAGFRFLALRESMDPASGRHIQFPIFEALGADLSKMQVGEDPRVEGIDWFGPDEIGTRPIFPHFPEDLVRLARGESIDPFKTLLWIP
ncbi:hypothetical protein AUK22_09185 [bacterium CG2_30_54_10]|nr:MAG: hypothetical protein AUK22_09185 [bacterium CG2_30_54_10]